MKHLFKLTSFLVICIFFSCTREDNVNKPKLSSNFGKLSISKKIDVNIIDAVSVYELNSKFKNSYRLDFKDPSLISIENSPLKAISLPEIINSNSMSKRGKSFIIDQNGNITKSFITEVVDIDDMNIGVKYFSEKGTLMIHYSVDKKNGNIEFIFPKSTPKSAKTLSKTCGEAVAECISEKYTDNGWDSVFLSIGSALTPAVAAGVALICVYESDECS
ncbi:hypothetical protein [Capnocytophaga canimorsus]|uniref:hypothetical protein n=1 Tax=Capnocytophaga canimorsus TaxID=28188 RepID=UPI000D6E0160|nr:hypothetical protein [Capnocytophaga canimorsus]AWL78858.1 hypothetical protein DKB58_07855 [Capnocytophaga canimorsus]AYW37463.1 hypothetical protein D8L92_09300 [Capnocytophaga canimorsus]